MDEINKNVALEKEARSQSTSSERLTELATLTDHLAEIVAGNVSAPPELLSELAKHEKKAIRRLVTSNPNTPTETLFKLGEYFPQEFLNNPVFELLVLEDSNILNNIPEYLLTILIQQQKVPHFLLQYAANHTDTLIVATANMHIAMSGEITEKWHEAVKATVQEYVFIDKFILDFHGVIHGNRNRRRRLVVSYTGNPDIPRNSFRVLANFYELIQSDLLKSKRFKSITAKNPNTNSIILKQLACDRDNHIRYCVAENPNTPTEILKLLVNDSDNGIRNALARNPNTPIEILEAFSDNSDRQIRISVANNPNTPTEILNSFASDRNDIVRFCVAGNISTPVNLLEFLANDSTSLVCGSVAKNPNTPLKILEKLANDSDYLVRESVSENPKCTHKIKEIIFKNFAKLERPSFSRVALFLSDYAESSVLAENSDSISWLERYAIAQNKKTPQETLKQLTQDGNRIVRATAKESLQIYY